MAEIKISKERLQELEKAEQKLSALECAGVDNWEGYEIAMEEINKQEKIETLFSNFVDKFVDLCAENLDYSESHLGAGFSRESCNVIEEQVMPLIKKLIKEFKEVENE